jgi:hypothetical protein
LLRHLGGWLIAGGIDTLVGRPAYPGHRSGPQGAAFDRTVDLAGRIERGLAKLLVSAKSFSE